MKSSPVFHPILVLAVSSENGQLRWRRLRAAAKALKRSRDGRKRLDWMIWYETAGQRNARATCRHFGIAPKVFYFWRKRYSEAALGQLEERSHRPHRARTSTLTGIEIERIVALRRQYMRYSKMQLAILYRENYSEQISSWKVQQVIERFALYPNPKRAENTAQKRQRAWKKRRITELTTKPRTGFRFGIDTIVRHFQGEKRYILTAIDRFSRLAYARLYTTHSSLNAADFLKRLHLLVGGKLAHIQTDNGSEFHVTLFAPPGLRNDAYRAVRRTLDDNLFRTALRRAIQGVLGKYPSLGRVRFTLSRRSSSAA